MQKPLLTLQTKDFLSGINPAGAHGQGGGLFFKADGVTPLFEAGTSQSVNNGLLMAGASGTTIGGSPNGNFLCSLCYDTGTRISAYFGTSTGRIFRQDIGTGDTPPTGANLTSIQTAGSAVLALESLQAVGGDPYIFYFLPGSVGRYDINAGTFNDSWGSASTDNTRASHKYFDQILYGGGTGKINSISDNGSAVLVNTGSVLDIPSNSTATAISDDGIYAIIAVSNNSRGDTGAYADTRILFWDGFSSSWLREYPLTDPLIYAIKKTPVGVFAFGITGIWQVTFGEVKKIFSHPPGVYTVVNYNVHHYGKSAVSYFSDSLVWGGTSGSNYAIKSLGKLDSSAPNAYLHPFLSTAGQNITLVDGQLLKGWLYVADDTPQLKAYPFSTTNAPQTGVSAQTIYYPLPYQVQIEKIKVTFGEPLASGDAFDIDTKIDEDTAAVDFDSVSYAVEGAVRSKVMTPKTNATPRPNQQISFVLNWTGGAVKIKSIKVYGEAEEDKTE